MNINQRILWIFVLAGASIMAISSFGIAIWSNFADASGWWQVFLGAVSIPLLFYELSRLRQAVERKPVLSIGLVNINDYPLSNIRAIDILPTDINVGRGYPHFTLAVKNSGSLEAKFVKIHFEFHRPQQTASLATTTVKVYEWLGDKRYSFKQDNNFDFIFVGGVDWVLHPNDTETFSFFMSTTMVIEKEPIELRERPALGEYSFQCTVWAEGLESPVQENFTVTVVESIKGESR
jgi:hypothetical protein